MMTSIGFAMYSAFDMHIIYTPYYVCKTLFVSLWLYNFSTMFNKPVIKLLREVLYMLLIYVSILSSIVYYT